MNKTYQSSSDALFTAQALSFVEEEKEKAKERFKNCLYIVGMLIVILLIIGATYYNVVLSQANYNNTQYMYINSNPNDNNIKNDPTH